jgi:TRAP-type mannitol/chloroaromatic compound transport system permease small subunit
VSERTRLATLSRLSQRIDQVNDTVGRAVAWLALAMVLVQFLVVLMRYIFGVGSLFLQESIVYLHGTMFMVGAGYTLLYGHHVRVDLFYREASARWKAKVDLAGVLLFLLPVCTLIAVFGWPYVYKAWAVQEGSIESSGIQAVYLLKTVILVFAVVMALQGISLALKSILRLAGVEPPEPPGPGVDPEAAAAEQARAGER